MDKQEYIDTLYKEFINVCGYITVSRETVEMFVNEFGIFEDKERAIDLLRDFILSQGLEEDIEL